MAIGTKRNFTITDLNKRTIVLRRCSAGGALPAMKLTKVYGESYSLGLLYASAGSKSAWHTGSASGTQPTLIDLATVQNADPSLSINILTSVMVDRTQGVEGAGTILVPIGFSGSFDIQAGSPFIKPKVYSRELKTEYVADGTYGTTYEYTYTSGALTKTVSMWDIELDDQEAPPSFSIGGTQVQDDPLKTKYVIPFTGSSSAEWSAAGVALAYKYELGDFMSGVIRFRVPGAGGSSPSPICGTSIE